MKTGVPAIDNDTAPFIAGSDECGYGAWAGPLVVCVVVVPRGWAAPAGLTDSKKMSHAAMRRARETFLAGTGTWFDIGWASSEEIDRAGVYEALCGLHTTLMGKTIMGRGEARADVLRVVDGTLSIEGCVSLPKADLLVPAVSMASVLGKLARDEHMTEMDRIHPGYGFNRHVGYGTPGHQEALGRLGPCPIHRRSYRPIAELIASREKTETETWMGFEEEPNPTQG